MDITIPQQDINLFKSVTCASSETARSFLIRYSNVDTAISHYFQAQEQNSALLKSPSPHSKSPNFKTFIPSISHFIRHPESKPNPQPTRIIKALDFNEDKKKDNETSLKDMMNIEKEENKGTSNVKASHPAKTLFLSKSKRGDRTEEEKISSPPMVMMNHTKVLEEKPFISKNIIKPDVIQPLSEKDSQKTKPTSDDDKKRNSKIITSKPQIKPHPHPYEAEIKAKKWPKFLGTLRVDCMVNEFDAWTNIKPNDQISFEPREIQFSTTNITKKTQTLDGPLKREIIRKKSELISSTLLVRCLWNYQPIGYLNCDFEEIFVFLLKMNYISLTGTVLPPDPEVQNGGQIMDESDKIGLHMHVLLTEEVFKSVSPDQNNEIEDPLDTDKQERLLILKLAKEALGRLFTILKIKVTIPPLVKRKQKNDPFEKIKNEKYGPKQKRGRNRLYKPALGSPIKVLTDAFPDYYLLQQQDDMMLEPSEEGLQKKTFADDEEYEEELVLYKSDSEDEMEEEDSGKTHKRLRRSKSSKDDFEGEPVIEEENKADQEILTTENQVSSYFVASEPFNNLKSELYAYQKQALSWMKYREGVLTKQQLFEKSYEEQRVLNDLFQEMLLVDGTKLYFNPFNGEVSKVFPEMKACKGGILADEMGLGKTVMTIALIHSNKRNKENSGLNATVIKGPSKPEDSEKTVKKRGGLNAKRNLDLEDFLSGEEDDPDFILTSGTKKLKIHSSLSITEETPKKVLKQGSNLTKLGGTLIVVTLNVLSQWQSEIERHSNPNTLTVYQYYGDNRKKVILEDYDVILTTYGTLASEHSDHLKKKNSQSQLFECEWFRVILDEGHFIRTRQTKTAKAACALKAENRWCLTGTPLQNKMDDMFSLLQFLKLETWGDYFWWNTYINKETSHEEASKLIRGILKPVILRRTKKSTYLDGRNILDLPPKEVENVMVKLSQEENEIYQHFFKEAKKEFNRMMKNGSLESEYLYILVIILRLRQVCDHPSLIFSQKDLKNRENLEKAVNHFLQKGSAEEALRLGAMEEEIGEGENQQSEFIRNTIEKLENKEVEPCCICLEDIVEASILTCGHIFCNACLNLTLKTTQKCALCQIQITSENVMSISLTEIKTYHTFPSLKQVSNIESSKLKAVIKASQDVASKGQKVVIFSQFLGMLDLVQKNLEKLKVRCTRIDGSMPMKERNRCIETFKQDPGLTVFLISLKAGATGLNLTVANHVFLVDPWWNPTVEDQAIQRIHRIGQKEKVYVKRFVCEKTIEERVLQLNIQKNEMISNVLHFNPIEQKKTNIQNIINALQGFDDDDDDNRN